MFFICEIFFKKNYKMSLFDIKKLPVTSLVTEHLVDYPTPANISYMWNFGFFGSCLSNRSVGYWYFFSNALYSTY